MGAAAAEMYDPREPDEIIALDPDEEAELRTALKEAEEDDRAGRLIPAALFLEQRGMR